MRKHKLSTGEMLIVFSLSFLVLISLSWANNKSHAQTVTMLRLKCVGVEVISRFNFGIINPKTTVDTVICNDGTTLIVPETTATIQKTDEKPVQIHAGLGIDSTVLAIYGYDGTLTTGGRLIRFNRKVNDWSEVKGMVDQAIKMAKKKNWLDASGTIRQRFGCY